MTPQHCPWSRYPINYGTGAQGPIPNDDSKPLNKKEIKFIQQVVGSFLLLLHHQHHHSWSTQQIMPTASKCNWSNIGMMKAIFRLHRDPSWCRNMILCIQHDTECSFGCLIFLSPMPTANQRTYFSSAPSLNLINPSSSVVPFMYSAQFYALLPPLLLRLNSEPFF